MSDHEQEVQRRAAAHELHRLEQLAERPAGDHHGERLVAVHRRDPTGTGTSSPAHNAVAAATGSQKARAARRSIGRG